MTEPAPDFAKVFYALTRNAPYPWQQALFDKFLSGSPPRDINLPTGSGKTAIMAIWLAALAHQAVASPQNSSVPRRLVWVIDRRVVVDQATSEAEQIRSNLANDPGDETVRWLRQALFQLSRRSTGQPLAISTLRGEREDNQEWSRDPSLPAIIVGTVDMVGSRLLFSGYGDREYWSPQHAGLLGQDTLIVNDEAHLTPAFAALLERIEVRQKQTIRPFITIRLSATHTKAGCWPPSLELDQQEPRFARSFRAQKGLDFSVVAAAKVESTIVELTIAEGASRTLVFVREPEKVTKLAAVLAKRLGSPDRILTLTGTMRGFERDQMAQSEVFKAFAAFEPPSTRAWLLATSAGEVGINISADRLITDLDTIDRLLQRLGRLNRFGESSGVAHVVVVESEIDARNKDDKTKRKRSSFEFLEGLPKRLDGLYDVSPYQLFGRELPESSLSEMPLLAPLHPWHLDVWSQTSLGSHPARIAVDPWLHGKQDDIPQTFIAWRNDVPFLVKEQTDPAALKDVFQKFRLRSHETLREPTSQLVDKLIKLAKAGKEGTKLLLVKPRGGAEVISINKFRAISNDAERRAAITCLAFGSLVLPPNWGGLVHGMLDGEWTPRSEEELRDEKRSELTSNDVSGCVMSLDSGLVVENARACFLATEASDHSWTLNRLNGKPDQGYEPLTLQELSRNALQRLAAENGWRFLLQVPVPQPEDSDEPSLTLLYFGKARVPGKPVQGPYLLEQHLADVSRYAESIASAVGLPTDLTAAFRLAGIYHDLGKSEMIWQKAAGNVRPDGGYVAEGAVAKSIRSLRGRDLNGFRHELASLRHLQSDTFQIPDHLKELIYHFIAAHHGNGRPGFTEDAFDKNHLKESDRLALSVIGRFASLQREYGWWGLAYLEAILRAADGLASANYEEPSDA